MPMYRYMDSHPQQMNQTFSSPQPFLPNPPMACVPWPYGGNYGYPNPVPFYSCCNHSNVPGYNGFRPSYAHSPMPSPVHFVGGSPAPFHEAYPVHYVPPPHYSMELPKYDYDKRMTENYHCCGCPNHHCHQNVNEGVKINEQGSPDVVEKKANGSLVPDQMLNYPHPIVWIPQEYMNGGEQRKLSGPNPPESLKLREGDRKHGLFPFDIDNIGSLMQGGNGERVRDQRGEDRKREFPFPIVWMPSNDNKHDGAGKKDKDMDASRDQQTEEQEKQFPFPFPFFWLPYENKQKHVGNEEEINEDNRKVIANPRFVPQKYAGSGDNETRVNEEKSARLGVVEGKEKDANQKVIPVKHMDPHKDNSEDTKRRGREVHVKHGDNKFADKQPSDNTVRSQSSSPKKSSRLPPVCLRVDPLPSKKSGSGRSRSPSPPGPKKVQKETSTDTAMNSASCDLRENSNGEEVEPPEKEKVIQVVDKGISEDRDQETGKTGDKIAQNVEETENTSRSAKSVTFERKSLSDVAAAVLIQSYYRGFMVRRWEPLKKLKQIAELREQVSDIRNQITSLETSDIKKDDKQRMVIGETIMRLLLRLDTIQVCTWLIYLTSLDF